MSAKINVKNITMAIAGCFLLSCAPKYTAHFQQKSYDPYEYKIKDVKPEQPVAITSAEEEVLKNDVEIKEVVLEPKKIEKLAKAPDTEIIKPKSKSELIQVLKDNPDATVAINLDKKQKRALKREVKEQLKEHEDLAGVLQNTQGESKVLYYILAVLLPPLAVGLWRGIGSDFWINLLLTLLLYLPGIIHAIIVISSKPKMTRPAAY